MYSLAIVLWEVFSRQKPYADVNCEPIAIPGLAAKWPAGGGIRPHPLPGPSAALNVLIKESWAAVPTERPTAETIHRQLLGEIDKINHKERRGENYNCFIEMFKIATLFMFIQIIILFKFVVT